MHPKKEEPRFTLESEGGRLPVPASLRAPLPLRAIILILDMNLVKPWVWVSDSEYGLVPKPSLLPLPREPAALELSPLDARATQSRPTLAAPYQPLGRLSTYCRSQNRMKYELIK